MAYFERISVASLTNFTRICPSTNDLILDQSTFWSSTGINWDSHRIGWVICGSCAIVTTIIGGTNIFLHCRNYNNKLEQRQIIRILLMPIVFAILSFVGYRYFQNIVYFQLARNTYEAFTIAAFMILMLCFLADSPAEQREILSKKDKRKMVFPLCCFRFRASKPAFFFTVKWSVMQFVVVKPLISLASVITEVLGVYCASSQSPYFANVYLEAIDFVSVSVALYGLITLYSLTREELKSHRPLAKFITIKLIVALVFYQGFVFTILQRYNVIKATQYWTATNVGAGLNALVTTAEMVLIALFQLYAYPHSEYKIPEGGPHTSFWMSFFHSQNYADFVIDIFQSLKFFFDRYILRKDYTFSKTYNKEVNKYDLNGAFNNKAPLDSTNSTSEGVKENEAKRYEVDMNGNGNKWNKEEEDQNAYPPQRQQQYYSQQRPSNDLHNDSYSSSNNGNYNNNNNYEEPAGEGLGRAHYSNQAQSSPRSVSPRIASVIGVGSGGSSGGGRAESLPYKPLREEARDRETERYEQQDRRQQQQQQQSRQQGRGGYETEWNGGGGYNAQ